MCAVRNSAPTSDDVIDLVSDDDNEDVDEDRSTQTLQELCELASLRSLIPRDFLSKALDSDFNFFNKELALALLKIPGIKACSPAGGITSTAVPLNSNSSTVSSTTTPNTISGGSLPPKIKQARGQNRKSATITLDGRQNKKVAAPGSSSRCKEGIVISNSNDTNQKVSKTSTISNGIVSPSIANSSPASNFINKLTSSIAKTLDTPTPTQSVSYRGFTITPSINSAPTTNNTALSEVRRKPPPFSYFCQKCPEKFKYNIALLDHLSTIHGISSDPISKDFDRSNKKSKTNKIKIPRRGRPKNVSNDVNSPPSVKIKRNPKGTRTKRKSKTSDGVIAKKALSNAQEPCERLSPEKSKNQLPTTVVETETAEEKTASTPEHKKNKSASSPLLNGDDSTDDSSLADNLIMDIGDGQLPDSMNHDAQAAFSLDAASVPIDSLMKSFKFLTYAVLESDKGKFYRCSLCGKNSQAIERFLDHFEKSCWRSAGGLKCPFPDCSSSTFSPKVLRDHFKTNHNIVTHSCEVCRSYFVDEEDLKEHYRLLCISCDNSKYTCPMGSCKVEYFHELHFRSHLSRRHKIITASTCRICKLFFHKEDDLKDHLKTQEHVLANVKHMRKLNEVRKLRQEQEKKKKDLEVCGYYPKPV
ncbi:unnamed protein product [Bemisia tabaci]|uniref:C2H2-type domain-containing protein n=1 Tax=Bemisia tabaci TaxID=7038 RepID=A0A9P0F6H6_BEMTA|nr:unnamed protein product [Bemisia tabaci]